MVAGIAGDKRIELLRLTMTFSNALKAYSLHFILCILMITYLYYNIVSDMVIHWYKDENFSHGFIVPVISGYFLKTRWKDLEVALVEPWGPGIVFVFVGIVLILLGKLGGEYFTMRISLLVLLAGLILFFFGRSVFRIVRLPFAYLLFMIPIPYIIYNEATFPLKIFITKISVGFLKLIGVVVLREGNIIMFPEFSLEVADACSGMRSLMSLLALGVAYAFISQKSATKRWIIVISTIPIAIVTNSFRVILTGILAQYWGAGVAEGFFHEFAGLIVFVLAISLMLIVGFVLSRGNDNISRHL